MSPYIIVATRLFLLFWSTSITSMLAGGVIGAAYGKRGLSMSGLVNGCAAFVFLLILFGVNRLRARIRLNRWSNYCLGFAQIAMMGPLGVHLAQVGQSEAELANTVIASPVMLILCFALFTMAAILAMSSECSLAIFIGGIHYPTLRIFGSIGFGAAALTNAFAFNMDGPYFFQINCTLVGLASFLSLLLGYALKFLDIDQLAHQGQTQTGLAHPMSMVDWSKSRLLPLYLMAFAQGVCIRPFEVHGTAYFNSQPGATGWLVMMIVWECAWLRMIKSSPGLISIGGIVWSLVYLCLSISTKESLFVAMALVALNCPVQTAAQKLMATQVKPEESIAYQSILMIMFALGGAAGSCILAFLGTKPGNVWLDACMLSLLMAPVIASSVIWQRHVSAKRDGHVSDSQQTGT